MSNEAWTTDETPFTGTTRIGFVLDSSNSMAGLKAVTISGFNEWLKVQRDTPGECDFTLTIFDTDIKTPIKNKPITVVAMLTGERYRPEQGGMTALYDAIAYTVKEVDKEMRPGDRALIPILTDGLENASKEFSLRNGGQARIKAMIESYEKKGNWTFAYLSASISAINDATSIGIMRANAAQFEATPQGTQSAFGRMSTSTATYRSQAVGQSVNFYSDEDPGDEDQPKKSK